MADAPPFEPVVVIAHIDGGINPYHEEFRDTSPLAYEHPCTYILLYPCNATALWLDGLNLTGPEVTWNDRFQEDRAKWDGLLAQWNNTTTRPALRGKLFWIPGTKIVGAVRMGTGGHNCQLPTPPPSIINQPNLDPNNPTAVTFGCLDFPILDDHGHATMTATRMGGNTGSLCPKCRVVSIEGLGGASTRWAADRGWVDVQTNSWLNLVPPPVNQVDTPAGGIDSTTEAFIIAQDKMLTYAASGNGASYILGYAPTPTWILSTAAPGVILVGAHDNGYVNPWSGTPAHVVADGYRGLSAGNRNVTGIGPTPFACCTSAASPYAAGVGAAAIYKARQLLGDSGVGLRVVGPLKAIAVNTSRAGQFSGPLSDGILTLDEAKALVKKTAEARPAAGMHDGAVHWMATGDAAGSADLIQRWGPGANPYCGGCWASPVRWVDVDYNVPAYASIGYGATNERSAGLAGDVLEGTAALPARAEVDAFFEKDGLVRAPFFADPT